MLKFNLTSKFESSCKIRSAFDEKLVQTSEEFILGYINSAYNRYMRVGNSPFWMRYEYLTEGVDLANGDIKFVFHLFEYTFSIICNTPSERAPGFVMYTGTRRNSLDSNCNPVTEFMMSNFNIIIIKYRNFDYYYNISLDLTNCSEDTKNIIISAIKRANPEYEISKDTFDSIICSTPAPAETEIGEAASTETKISDSAPTTSKISEVPVQISEVPVQISESLSAQTEISEAPAKISEVLAEISEAPARVETAVRTLECMICHEKKNKFVLTACYEKKGDGSNTYSNLHTVSHISTCSDCFLKKRVCAICKEAPAAWNTSTVYL